MTTLGLEDSTLFCKFVAQVVLTPIRLAKNRTLTAEKMKNQTPLQEKLYTNETMSSKVDGPRK